MLCFDPLLFPAMTLLPAAPPPNPGSCLMPILLPWSPNPCTATSYPPWAWTPSNQGPLEPLHLVPSLWVMEGKLRQDRGSQGDFPRLPSLPQASQPSSALEQLLLRASCLALDPGQAPEGRTGNPPRPPTPPHPLPILSSRKLLWFYENMAGISQKSIYMNQRKKAEVPQESEPRGTACSGGRNLCSCQVRPPPRQRTPKDKLTTPEGRTRGARAGSRALARGHQRG